MRNRGMRIAYIRNYIVLCKQGDKTLDQRYEILKKQKEILLLQQQELNKHMEMINYKIDLHENKLK